MEQQGGMTLKEVAACLGCSYRHVKRLVKLHDDTDGKHGLESMDVGTGLERHHRRVSTEQLERFVSRRHEKRERRLARKKAKRRIKRGLQGTNAGVSI